MIVTTRRVFDGPEQEQVALGSNDRPGIASRNVLSPVHPGSPYLYPMPTT